MAPCLPPAPRHRRRRLLTSQAISSPRTRRWAARTSPLTGCGPTTTRACPSSSSRRAAHTRIIPHVHACACARWAQCAVRGGRCVYAAAPAGRRIWMIGHGTANTRHGGSWHPSALPPVRPSMHPPFHYFPHTLPPFHPPFHPSTHPGDHSRASGAAGGQADDGRG